MTGPSKELAGPLDKSVAAAGDKILEYMMDKFAGRGSKRPAKPKKLLKRDSVIFAAIRMGLTGPKYCSFLHNHGIKPNWPDGATDTYPQAYKIGHPWPKKIQDEKTRARVRMKLYADSTLAEALLVHLPKEFDEITRLITLAELAGRE